MTDAPKFGTWYPIESAPDFDRIMVCGWQPRHGTTQGYWWWGEDAALQARPVRHLAWIVTAYGKPRSEKAASQWFAGVCRSAGVSKAAHGIRKYRAATMKEAGAGADARMAWLGHVTENEAHDYAKTADLKRVISA